MKKISVTIEDEQYKALEELIAKTGKNMSEVVRERLALGLKPILSEESHASSEPPFSKRQEEGLPQETQSVNQQAETFNFLEFADQHKCHHRLIDYESKKTKWTCAGKKIARSICVQRQQRYLHTSKGCFPQHLAKHCKKCGREIRPEYTYCYTCNEERRERMSDKNISPSATQPFYGDII